jgi:hypothetical protein
VNDRYLVLRRPQGVTLWDCLRRGLRIPLQAIQDTDAGLAHAVSRRLHGLDLHARNLMVHRGRGLIVTISDLLDPAPCRAWQDLRRAQHQLYRPRIAPPGLRAPGPLLDGLREGYRV